MVSKNVDFWVNSKLCLAVYSLYFDKLYVFWNRRQLLKKRGEKKWGTFQHKHKYTLLYELHTMGSGLWVHFFKFDSRGLFTRNKFEEKLIRKNFNCGQYMNGEHIFLFYDQNHLIFPLEHSQVSRDFDNFSNFLKKQETSVCSIFLLCTTWWGSFFSTFQGVKSQKSFLI